MNSQEVVRLYVGGVPPGVSSSDLIERFKPLGIVHSVVLPPAKFLESQRGFAYVDFEPASEASLRSLFSAYNGCKWRGGRLRIENAKEDYFKRLQRERDVEADLLKTTDAPSVSTTVLPVAKLANGRTFSDGEAEGLKIYFPRFGKMKTVPRKGLGKHKRSFQRVESSPLHLLTMCSCDEHLMGEGGNMDSDIVASNVDATAMAALQERKKQLELLTRLFPADSAIPRLSEENVSSAPAPEATKLISRSTSNVATGEIGNGDEMDLVKDLEKIVPTDCSIPSLLDVGVCPAPEGSIPTSGTVTTTADSGQNHCLIGPYTSEPSSNLQGPETIPSDGKEDSKWVQKGSWKSIVGDTGRVAFSLDDILGSSSSQPDSSINAPALQENEIEEDLILNISTDADGVGPTVMAFDSAQKTRRNRYSSPKHTRRVAFSLDMLGSSLPQPGSSQNAPTLQDNEIEEDLILNISTDADGVVPTLMVSDPAQKTPRNRLSTPLHTGPRKKVAKVGKSSMLESHVSNTELCPFMKSANAEEEWLATKSELRADFRAKHRYAVRHMKKLWARP